MSTRKKMTVDGNEAAASVAHRVSEVIAIYPITPSSTMGELADEWSAHGEKNIWGTTPHVMEMQSEGGAAGAIHGALQAGALATTFTASQGLLLMLPNMYKIAGELTPFCMHVTARTIATHALSIFGDHSDVMSARQTGFAMLSSNSVQEAHDFAAVAHAATLKARVPFIHFFDGFRTSHEVAKIEELTDADLLSLLDPAAIDGYRQRALTPDRPVLHGTSQNPDVFFQAREAANVFYDNCASIVQSTFDLFAALTGRRYRVFEYFGHPDAERLIVMMGSGSETVQETIEWLSTRGEKVGLLKVRLFRPFSLKHFLQVLPKSVRSIAVLDRTKEPGALGEPLYQDIVTALYEAREADPTIARHTVIGGRYGLASKEFTPSMVKAIYDELAKPNPKRHFTVGIQDDVTNLSLPYDPHFDIESEDTFRCLFYGLGSDGTVGANKNSIKIIGEETDLFAQGYFVYDSKKSGASTISHLRFGPRPIKSAYLIQRANFVACHQTHLLDRLEILSGAAEGAVFLLNSPVPPEGLWDSLPQEAQQTILDRKLKLYTIDAYKVAKETGMGGRINTIMQTCFFGISGVLPQDDAIAQIKKAIKKTYEKKGEEIVRRNFAAVDYALSQLKLLPVPAAVTSTHRMLPAVSDAAPDFVKRVTAAMISNHGDLLPVSAFPPDGAWPLGTARWEKRNLAREIPVWDPKICIQCNKCALVCPHAAIRPKVYAASELTNAPETFKSIDYKTNEFPGAKYTLQVAAEDCTGCSVCVMVCPAKDRTNPIHKAIDMAPQEPLVANERKNFCFFLALPEADRTQIKLDVKGTQFLQPLFEFSGACAGCGETPYLKLLTQLFGDRSYIANATGCSSIYGGNLPTTPYTTDANGRGPAWCNSLFEDNAEFGLGMRLAVDKHREQAVELLRKLSKEIGDTLVTEILEAKQEDEAQIAAQRQRVIHLRGVLKNFYSADAHRLEWLADFLVSKSVWIVGGDGWAYDIGFGGLDHVLASGRNVKILVLDTEVYSNTGGQQSKSTPMGAAAKFASAGKRTEKKDLALIAMSYGNVYVAKIAYGARDTQTVRALQEAEAYNGPALILAYSPCIAHGYDLARGLDQQKLAVDSTYWPLFRYDPRLHGTAHSSLQLDSGTAKTRLAQFMQNEARFRIIEQQDPDNYRRLVSQAQHNLNERYALYQQMVKPVPAAQSNGH